MSGKINWTKNPDQQCMDKDRRSDIFIIHVHAYTHVSLCQISLFFLTDTPRKLYYLHTCSWMANMFGVFLILAAHEHYSIDVFVAFYLTSRLFLYYHTLANNRSLMERDKGRRRFWFPLFSFFESKCDGVVPNEFEWPVPRMIEEIKNSLGSAQPLKPKTK